MLTQPPPGADSTPPDATLPLDDKTIPLADFKKLLGGRYELLEILGKGGMGVVHKAHDNQLEIDVAIKLLPEFLANDKRGVEILKTEARAAIKLSHPNIIRLFNFEDRPEGKFLIMEFIDGKTLDEVLDECPDKRMPEEDVIRYGIEACKGLGYAHSQGVIHRDIKPSNMMVDSRGCVKITDFGIARVIKESHTRQTGAVTSGTLLYMSPEQIRGRRCDARSDIYSLGIALYELLTGNVPFRSGDITHQHLNEVPPPMEDVSEGLNAIVLKCLDKEPENRFQSTGELIRALQAGRADVPPDAETKREQAAPITPSRRRRLPGAVAAVLIVLVVGLVIYTVYRRVVAWSAGPTVTTETDVHQDIAKIAEPEEEATNARMAALNADAKAWFPEIWEAAEEKFQAAQELGDAGETTRAIQRYREVAVDYKSVAEAARKIAMEKKSAENARNSMQTARREAEEVGAMTHAPDLWSEGDLAGRKADELFEGWEYVSAEELYSNAARAFQEAEKRGNEIVRNLSAEENERAEANRARSETEEAQRRADSEKASQYAQIPYRQGRQKLENAAEKYQRKEYTTAAALYREAGELFRASEREAAKRDELPAGLVRRGDAFINEKDGAEMKLIPAGQFVMGSPPGEGNSDEHPLHRIELDEFYIDKYEVTVEQYMKFVYETGHRAPPTWVSKYSPGSNHPIVGVSWEDAVAYAAWTGKRLPTEAEWEKAARDGDGRKYPWGLGAPDGGGYKANYNPGDYAQDGYEFTAPVGSFESGRSPFGVHDLAGNVAEWCQDWYAAGYYENSPRKNPTGPDTGAERVVRGGSWRGFAGAVRASGRSFFAPRETQIDVGFRCVKDAR
jgi:formylglycine-generating enzyme required for sulfatase activity